MTDYQDFWNREIENLLAELGNPESLHENIVDTLQNCKRTGIYVNQVINALRLGIAVKEGNLNIALVASMQSGKSKTIYFLCNYVLPAIGFIKEYESIIFVTSMRDTDLYEQNVWNLGADYYDAFEEKHKSSKIRVMKMSDFFNHPNPEKVVKDYKVKLIVRDEDQYGCGEESSFKYAFFDELRRKLPNIMLLAVSATPYDILDAHIRKLADVEVVEGIRTPTYYGITEMLRDDRIQDLPEDFSPLQQNGDEFIVHPLVNNYIQHLLSFKTGLGIIRESNTIRATELRDLLKKEHSEYVDVLVIGSNDICDFSINEGLSEVSNLVLRRGKRVVLIVVQALTAGKDLGKLKEEVRFGIEPRDKQLANGVQGITGRCCGYHSNRSFKILASKELLLHYSQFEQDWEIFNDSDWREGLFENSVKSLTTQTKYGIEQKEGVFTHIDDIFELSYNELKSEEGRKKLDFLEDAHYDKVLEYFTSAYYESQTKGLRLGAKDVTIRLASSYATKDNRVFKNWNADKSSDFGNVFFKKTHFNYGLLINNYPKNHPLNPLGFCGIKVYKAGNVEQRQRILQTENNSMYIIS